MHTFAIFLAWAVVSGASAWSSSEVPCGSCGSECQKTCGTRNFRACCFNFQRRRRSQMPSPFTSYSLKDVDDSDTSDITRLLRIPQENGQENPQLQQILRSIPQQNREDPIVGHVINSRGYSQYLSSMLPAFLQESSEEEDAEDGISSVLLPSQEVEESRSSPSAAAALGSSNNMEDLALSRLLLIGLHRPSASSLQKQSIQRRYSPVTSIRK